MENNVAGVNRIFPRHKVVSQLNTLMADGTAINKVSNTKIDPRNGFKPCYKHVVRPNQEGQNTYRKQ